MTTLPPELVSTQPAAPPWPAPHRDDPCIITLRHRDGYFYAWHLSINRHYAYRYPWLVDSVEGLRIDYALGALGTVIEFERYRRTLWSIFSTFVQTPDWDADTNTLVWAAVRPIFPSRQCDYCGRLAYPEMSLCPMCAAEYPKDDPE